MSYIKQLPRTSAKHFRDIHVRDEKTGRTAVFKSNKKGEIKRRNDGQTLQPIYTY